MSASVSPCAKCRLLFAAILDCKLQISNQGNVPISARLSGHAVNCSFDSLEPAAIQTCSLQKPLSSMELYGSEGVLLTFPVNATPAGVIPYLENLPAMSAMINSTQLGPAQNGSAQYPGAQPSPMPTTAAEDVWVQGPLRVTFSAAECSVPTTPGMVVVGAVQHATGCCWLGLYHNP